MNTCLCNGIKHEIINLHSFTIQQEGFGWLAGELEVNITPHMLPLHFIDSEIYGETAKTSC